MTSVAPLTGDARDPIGIVEDLHRRYAAKIFQFCRHQLGSREEAEDATQVTFINALCALERRTSLDSDSGWLFTIAHNVCLNSRRSVLRRRRVESPSTLHEYHEAETSPGREPFALHGLVGALQALPPIQRRAILLREWQGLSYAEIAKDLGLSQAAVETLLFRARRTVAAELSSGRARRPDRNRIPDVSSVLTSLRGLLFGAAPKLASTAATRLATSVVGASIGVQPAESQGTSPVRGQLQLTGLAAGDSLSVGGSRASEPAASQRVAGARLRGK